MANGRPDLVLSLEGRAVAFSRSSFPKDPPGTTGTTGNAAQSPTTEQIEPETGGVMNNAKLEAARDVPPTRPKLLSVGELADWLGLRRYFTN